MKVVFGTGVESPITEVSSIYSLGIASVAEEDVNAFKALLTSENLESFSLVDDNGNTVDSAENFVFSGISDNEGIVEEKTETNFILRPMTPQEVRIKELEEENAILGDALAELAELVAGE